MSLRSLCTTTATISHKATAASSASNLGGHVDTFTAAYTSIPVTIQPKSSREVMEFARDGIQTNETAYTPTAVSAIATGDKLVADGITYLVTGWGDMAGRGRAWRIHLLRKQ